MNSETQLSETKRGDVIDVAVWGDEQNREHHLFRIIYGWSNGNLTLKLVFLGQAPICPRNNSETIKCKQDNVHCFWNMKVSYLASG